MWLFHFFIILSQIEIVGQLVNTLTVDEKYFRDKIENLLLPIQMQLSKK